MKTLKILILSLILLALNGCIVGDTLALIPRVTGDVVMIVSDEAGEFIHGAGDAIDVAIPF